MTQKLAYAIGAVMIAAFVVYLIVLSVGWWPALFQWLPRAGG